MQTGEGRGLFLLKSTAVSNVFARDTLILYIVALSDMTNRRSILCYWVLNSGNSFAWHHIHHFQNVKGDISWIPSLLWLGISHMPDPAPLSPTEQPVLNQASQTKVAVAKLATRNKLYKWCVILWINVMSQRHDLKVGCWRGVSGAVVSVGERRLCWRKPFFLHSWVWSFDSLSQMRQQCSKFSWTQRHSYLGRCKYFPRLHIVSPVVSSSTPLRKALS